MSTSCVFLAEQKLSMLVVLLSLIHDKCTDNFRLVKPVFLWVDVSVDFVQWVLNFDLLTSLIEHIYNPLVVLEKVNSHNLNIVKHELFFDELFEKESPSKVRATIIDLVLFLEFNKVFVILWLYFVEKSIITHFDTGLLPQLI